MHPTPSNSRLLAIRVLVAVLKHGQRADAAMLALPEQMEHGADRRFVHTLVYTTLRYYFSLEADVSRFVRDKPEPAVMAALLLGTCQLRVLETPPHAAVSATVDAIRILQPRAAALVNAILRQLTRHAAPKKLKPHQRLELPRWIYQQWRDHWGIESLEAIPASLRTPPPLSCAILGSRDEWLIQATASGLHAHAGTLSKQAVLLPGGSSVTDLPGYEQGNIMVMDQAAQASVALLVDGIADVNAPLCVLDLCAAPGGKTALLAHCLPQADVIAVEYSARRLPTLQQNMERLNMSSVSMMQADSNCLPLADQSVDAIFLDAPCSASGVMRKHPDVRFLHDQAQLERLAGQQLTMLNEAIRVLKPGGVLLYAVCSIHPLEHQAALHDGLNIDASLTLLPSEENDGFYAARLHHSFA
ncbi:MAG: transcription antitermination factor NusB [Mariprofundaceae bacterium]|nr:transcription antitermination factor NusB [Mariprofundaceae bacterium]